MIFAKWYGTTSHTCVMLQAHLDQHKQALPRCWLRPCLPLHNRGRRSR